MNKLNRGLTICLVILLFLLHNNLTSDFSVNAQTLTPQYVQSALAKNGGTVASLSITLPSAVTTGNTIVVAVSTWNASNNAAVSSVIDNFGNSYTKAVEDPTPNTGAVEPLSIWYSQNVKGGSNFKVTATTQESASITIAAHEYGGVVTVGVLDQTHHQSLTGSPVSSGLTFTTTQASEVLFGAANYQDVVNLSATAGTGYSLRQSQTDNNCCEVLYTEDQVVSTTGQYQSTFIFSQSLTYRAAIVTLKGITTSPTPLPTATPTPLPTSTSTPVPPTVTPTPTSTLTPLPTNTPTPIPPTSTPTSQPVSSTYFSVGASVTDVIPHQVVRTNTDQVYLFGALPTTNSLKGYRTTSPGYPNSGTDFNSSISQTESAQIISTSLAYDGNSTIHILMNLGNGNLVDSPFNITSNAFGATKILATGNPTNFTDIGTSGVSAMVDTTGVIHIAYWSTNNHITYVSYTYNSSTDTLTQVTAPTQVDSAGNSNHPSLAVSPVDNSLTVAWVVGTNGSGQLLLRQRTNIGSWGSIQQVSTAPVWTSPNFGLNIDQGPSMVYTPDGAVHLTYIENFDNTGDYGKIHYLTNLSGSFTDQSLIYYTHDPALAVDNNGNMYIIGHGHHNDPSSVGGCQSNLNLCTIKKNPDGSWAAPQLFATPPLGGSFDASTSVKWGVVGFNRPETIEFAFFDAVAGSYTNTVIWYGRIGTSGTITPTPTFTPTPGGSNNLTLQVNSSTDDANQDGTNLTTNGATVWLGTGQSTTSSYTGLRFNGVNISQGATITSAHLQVFSSQSQWITLAFNMYGENIGNSPTFSTSNLPSQRTLTAHNVSHSDDVPWNANTWYSLEDITPVIQDIVSRTDWASGNSLSIILKGTGSAYGRKSVTSFDGSAVNSPQLLITYH